MSNSDSVLILAILFLFLAFAGDPDLWDALISYLRCGR